MTDAYLASHAAAAYAVEPALVIRALDITNPFPLPADFLASARFTSDPTTPEHNAYLVARWIASLQAAGKSPNETLDTMTASASVSWRPPVGYLIWRACRTLMGR